ncbi:hypothetical protein [Microbulbifer taiwanensis]|uniref:hypothetical protein n=1 Tax=Microbulbifer taiwanensis TaxID=986746 RepID=UPI00361B74A3
MIFLRKFLQKELAKVEEVAIMRATSSEVPRGFGKGLRRSFGVERIASGNAFNAEKKLQKELARRRLNAIMRAPSRVAGDGGRGSGKAFEAASEASKKSAKSACLSRSDV